MEYKQNMTNFNQKMMHKKNKIEILYMQTIALILLFP